MTNSINLLLRSSKGKANIDAKKIHTLRMIALILLCAVAGMSVILFITIASSPLGNLRKQEKEADGKLGVLQAGFTKHLLTKNQLMTIETLLQTRPDLSKTYDNIQKNLPSDITLNSIGITASSVALSLRASSLSSLEHFLLSLQQKSENKELMANVVVSGIVFDPSTLTYSAEIAIK